MHSVKAQNGEVWDSFFILKSVGAQMECAADVRN